MSGNRWKQQNMMANMHNLQATELCINDKKM